MLVQGEESDVDSVASFTVDEPGLVDEANFGLTPAKLDWVTSIFGNCSVLKPLGFLEGEEVAPSAVHASLGAAEAAAAAAMQKQEGEREAVGDVPLPVADVDPDVLEKAYQLPSDHAFATSQEPERWLQTYLSGPLDEGRAWTDEEYQNEARWNFHQVFLRRGYERAITENAIVRVLSQLHDKKLEMIYIVEHVYWMVAKALTKEDLWKIQEYDFLWQPLWKRYLQLIDWAQELEEQSVVLPDYIKQKIQREVPKSAEHRPEELRSGTSRRPKSCSEMLMTGAQPSA